MANSLQEQLVKAGLASAEQARKSRTGKRKDRKQGKPQGDPVRRAAEQRRQEQAERGRALNEKRDAERVEKETRLRIRDMVLEASLNDAKADVAYNVLHGAKVRKIYVTEPQRASLAAGTLAVATARGRHHVIALEVADKIAELMPGYYVFRADKDATAQVPAEDDPYAEYTVPDDLVW
jgi:uncharacterized protein YaiL (DUF2058 family)